MICPILDTEETATIFRVTSPPFDFVTRAQLSFIPNDLVPDIL
jgi:hypothetical protein